MKEKVIESLGLSTQEAKAYLALLELGTSTVKPLAEKAGLRRTSVYNFIDHLLQLGLATRSVVRGRSRYSAVEPHQLLELGKRRVQDLEALLPELLALHNRGGLKPKISCFEGPAQVSRIVAEEPHCHKETLYIWPGREALEAVGGAAVMNEIDRRRIQRGVWVRTIRFRQKDAPTGLSAHGPKYLRELRWAPPHAATKIGMGIYDTGKVGFFSSKRESFGVLIESQELQELMTLLFRLLWAASSPAREGEG